MESYSTIHELLRINVNADDRDASPRFSYLCIPNAGPKSRAIQRDFAMNGVST